MVKKKQFVFIWKCCIYSSDKHFDHGAGIYLCIDSIDSTCKTEYPENLHCDKPSSHKETDVDCLHSHGNLQLFLTVRGWTNIKTFIELPTFTLGASAIALKSRFCMVENV